MSLELFISNLSNVISRSSPEQLSLDLANLLDINLSNINASNQVLSLQKELQDFQDESITELIDSKNFFDGDWPAFNTLLESYLKLCRDIDPSSILKSHDLLLVVFNDCSVAFLNSSFGDYMVNYLHDIIKFLVPMMYRLDVILNENVPGKKFKRLTFISTVLSKIFNHLRSLKGITSKKSLILYIVNELNKIYFIISAPLLCANIFSNMNLLDLKFSRFLKAQQVEYRYILGRYYLIKNELIKSFHHLNWSYINCHKNSMNRIKILRYLIPVSLLIGKVPSKQILNSNEEVQRHYIPLVQYLVQGNMISFQAHLFQNQEYFKSKSLLVLLVQKSRIIILRNLVLNILRYTNNQNYRVTFQQIQIALFKSIRTNQEQVSIFGNQYMYQLPIPQDSIQMESFVENVCVSLIENGIMKGNVLSKAKLVVLSKKDPFPDIFTTYGVKYGISSQEKWMDY